MFQLLDGFYTQAVRVDFNAASKLVEFNPEDTRYCAAAMRDSFVVAVLQGEVQESVYVARLEQVFETFAEAKSFYDRLITEHPEATGCDFTRPQASDSDADGSADFTGKPGG